MAPQKLRVALLLSGAGSTLQALIAAQLEIALVGVFSDFANAGGLQVATSAGIPTHVVARADYRTKCRFELALQAAIDREQPDLLVLAGFMRVLSAEFVEHYAGRMINLHPSLLPKFPGLDTHARAIDAGETEHGASVHWVTAELDGGPVIKQVHTEILPTDTAASLQARLKPLEQALLIEVVAGLAAMHLNA